MGARLAPVAGCFETGAPATFTCSNDEAPPELCAECSARLENQIWCRMVKGVRGVGMRIYIDVVCRCKGRSKVWVIIVRVMEKCVYILDSVLEFRIMDVLIFHCEKKFFS